MQDNPSTRTRLDGEHSGEAMRLALTAAHECQQCRMQSARVVTVKRDEQLERGHGLKPVWNVRLHCTSCGTKSTQQIDRWTYPDACAYEKALREEQADERQAELPL